MLHANGNHYADKTRSDFVRNSSVFHIDEETLKCRAKAGKSLMQHPELGGGLRQ